MTFCSGVGAVAYHTQDKVLFGILMDTLQNRDILENIMFSFEREA